MGQKWIAVAGSPRRHGNTEKLMDFVIEGLSYRGIEVDRYSLGGSGISSCLGCEKCFKTGLCIFRDSVSDILDGMKAVDGLILASPTHNYNVTAQVKAFLDRTFCLNDYSGGQWKSRLDKGKKAILVSVCAGASKESMGFTLEAMKRPLSELGYHVTDIIEYYHAKGQPVDQNDTIRNSILERLAALDI